MSRAFVKEADGADVDELPDRLISPHRNLVTAKGLAQIEAEVARLAAAYAEAQAAADRAQLAVTARDLRYWSQRKMSAEVLAPPEDGGVVHFGSLVCFEREDGRRQCYRIVGEDEADPAHGTISYVSPLARALMGKSAGERVRVANGEIEIVEVSAGDN